MSKDKESFSNWKSNAFHLNFQNGNHLSTTWAECTYSDNYDKDFNIELLKTKQHYSLPSETVEIMFDCGDKLRKKILKKYNRGNDGPIGYLNINEWSEIVSLLAKEKK